tara:strand:- start:257 stop:517 length:261 start_codon:yes stop_codon:yes gene_type:complete
MTTNVNEYRLSPALYAELTDGDTLLTVVNDELQDCDTYQLKGGEWTIKFDSLSSAFLPASEIWENEKFAEWAESIKPDQPTNQDNP